VHSQQGAPFDHLTIQSRDCLSCFDETEECIEKILCRRNLFTVGCAPLDETVLAALNDFLEKEGLAFSQL